MSKNRLTLIEPLPERRGLYRCSCGTEKAIRIRSVESGVTISCGCYHKEQAAEMKRTHGMHLSREYATWAGMRRRCYNPKAESFKHYGGRGIKICARWRNSFENFYADMGERPPGKEIDRKDNNGNYTPSNCKWSTRREQMSNTRNTKRLTHNGVTLTAAQWADSRGISRDTMYYRLRHGWEISKILERRKKWSRT